MTLAGARLALALSLLGGCGARTQPGGLSSTGLPPDASAGDDARVPADASPDTPAGCPDGGSEVVVALDSAGGLYRYYPATGSSISLGTPACDDSNVQWTLTATAAHAYIAYTDGSLYVVDLATMVCTPTAFQPGQLGLDFDFGIAAVGSGASEQLYYYGVPTSGESPILAVSDTQSFVLEEVGAISPAPPASGGFPVNLTADGAGHLYAFSPVGLVQEIDATSAAVLQAVDTGVTSGSTWATIAYGSRLFLWVDTEVVGYDLATRSRTSELDAGLSAVGASAVSGCAGP
jgi:hypothetical protein